MVGLVAVSVPAMWGMGRPERLPHQPDTLFHLNTIQLMRDTGAASSLHAAELNSAGGAGFHPAAFHDIPVAVATITGADVRVAANATALVAGAAIWTTGCILLARQVFGPSRLPLPFAALVGLALSHPNALVSAVLFSFLIVAWPLTTWLRHSRRERPVLSGLVALAYLAVPVLWVLEPVRGVPGGRGRLAEHGGQRDDAGARLR